MNIKCVNCETEFLHNKKHHKFCSEECAEEHKRVDKHTFPKYICTKCRFEVQLCFSPVEDKRRFMEYKCEKCGSKNIEN